MGEIMGRPMPPAAVLEPVPEVFVPAEDLRDWAYATFIEDGAPLANPDHAHLMLAEVRFLWTNVDNERNMMPVLGQAELMPPMAMGKWQRARAIAQIEDWFDGLPDFVITIHGPAAASVSDAQFCALIEHELYHCGQQRDQYGAPKFTQDGRPKFAIRGHDVEEFVGVVARYGAVAAGVSEMVEAAAIGPLVAPGEIAGACGTCRLKVA